MACPVESEPSSLLEVRSLAVIYRSRGRTPTAAVRDVDLEIAAGEAVGVLGESGCGKSTLALALLGLLPAAGSVRRGSVRFEGRELLDLEDGALDRLRGDRLSMVFQEPGLALSPFLRVGTQIADVLRAHHPVSADRARERVLELLRQVRLAEPEAVLRAYPHQLSGGQQQRVVLAQALICRPALLIADEPTAALDTVTQAALVDLLGSLARELGMALLFISHDPQLLARVADRIVVMYAGRIVEDGPTRELLTEPAHPYPRELLRCLPAHGAGARRGALHVIPGAPPGLAPPPPGCAFAPRCPERIERCTQEDAVLEAVRAGRRVACWNSPVRPA